MPAGATYEPIATTTVSSTTTGVTLSSIPSTYTDLLIVTNIITTAADRSVYLRVNGDTGSNYSYTSIYGEGTAAASGRSTSQTRSKILGEFYGTSTTVPCNIRTSILSYAGSTNKTFLSSASGDKNGTGEVGRFVGLWRSTSAINSITIDTGGANDIASGTTITLYGIKAA